MEKKEKVIKSALIELYLSLKPKKERVIIKNYNKKLELFSK